MPSDIPNNAGDASLSQLLDQGKYQEVVSLSAARIASAPDDRKALGALVEGLLGFGHMPGAIEALRKALTAAPDNDLAALGLAVALRESDPKGSRRLIHGLFASPGTDLFRGEEGPVKISPVIDVAEWCKAQGSVVLDPAEDVTVFDPVRQAQAAYRSEPVVSSVVPGGTVVADWDFALTADGAVLNGTGFNGLHVAYTSSPHFFDAAARKAIHAWPAECVDVAEDALFVSGVLSAIAFGHWIVDFLPRLRGWRGSNQRALKIAAWRSLDQHQCDTLAQFGVRGSDIIWCEPRKRYRFRNLTIVMPGDMYRPNPAVTRFLYRGLGPDPSTRPRRNEMGRWFFLERSGTKRGRNIVNADETKALLEEIGFEYMRRPEVPVPRQNEMFRDAGIIVTVYGSDVYALYQLRPGADLVVLYPDYMAESGTDYGTAAIASMCQTVGVGFHAVPCARGPGAPGNEYYLDVVVDCDALRRCLYDIIERRSLDYAASWETPS